MKNTQLFLLIILTISMCLSCRQNTAKDRMLNFVRGWEGKEIIYPSLPFFTIYGEDTLMNYVKTGAKYSIVSYIDSLGCFSCKLQAKEWKDFIKRIDSISNFNIPVNIFVHNGNREDIISILKKENFDIPICLDFQDSLRILNDFPDNIAFRTFLLDSRNKVIAIGNPIFNPKVKELYLKIIRGEEVGVENNTKVVKTKLDIDHISVSLGSFDWKEEQKTTFVIKNTGDRLLVIEGVNTSCGCTTVTYSKEPVQPGKEIVLEVSYKAEYPGHFNKTVTVYCNAETSPLVLQINGYAK